MEKYFFHEKNWIIEAHRQIVDIKDNSLTIN